MFSKTCEYAIRATLYIAQRSLEGDKVKLTEISEEIESPVAFTAKILQTLRKNGLIDSVQGSKGGFKIEESQVSEIKLSDIVKAIDGDQIYVGCGLGLKRCNPQAPCPLHDHFLSIRNDLKSMLQNTAIIDLTPDMMLGNTVLRRPKKSNPSHHIA